MQTLLRTAETDELLAVSHRHPLVRHLAPHRIPGQPAWVYGAAVALVNGYWDGADEGGDIMLVGPPDDAAELASRLVVQGRPISMPATAYELLPQGLLSDPSRWGFRWITDRVDVPDDAAAWLPQGTDAEVDRLLDDAFPEASFRPGSPRVRCWAGIRDDQGRLVACAADTTEAVGLGFVAAITTRPELRGRGVGRRITGWTLNQLLARDGTAALWHYGGNLAAARVYDALGMQTLPMVAATPSSAAQPSEGP